MLRVYMRNYMEVVVGTVRLTLGSLFLSSSLVMIAWLLICVLFARCCTAPPCDLIIT
jgi:hypothetical protein